MLAASMRYRLLLADLPRVGGGQVLALVLGLAGHQQGDPIAEQIPRLIDGGVGVLHHVMQHHGRRSLPNEAPLERPVVSQRIMMASKERSLTVSIGNRKNLEPPYNGYTVLHGSFTAWLASCARKESALVITNAVVDELIQENGCTAGVKTRLEDGNVRANVVILADGVNSLLAQQSGLRGPLKRHEVGLGVKELLALPESVISERFGVRDGEGASYSVIGDFARDIPGGGFVYTNKSTISLGLVVSPQALCEQGATTDDVLERFKSIPDIARLVEGADLVEYSAHLIPEEARKPWRN